MTKKRVRENFNLMLSKRLCETRWSERKIIKSGFYTSKYILKLRMRVIAIYSREFVRDKKNPIKELLNIPKKMCVCVC